MRSRASYYLIALLSVLVVACQMPAGFGPQRNLVGEGEDTSPGTWTSGALSVVIDEERGQAVFINENGERFDVSAVEYEGAPLIRCVQVESFTEVPPMDDPEALQIKALVTGTRDDGTLGAWEIHNDNTIHLTPGEDGQARCLDGTDSASVLDGMQTRWGWQYNVTGTATDGKVMIIVGYAVNTRGITYGSTQVLPGTSVGVYWKVWRLPYSRFCLISPPRIIGNLEKPVAYSRISVRLIQLKLFFLGRLESYLTVVNPSPAVDEFPATPAVRYDSLQRVYVVNGVENQDGVHAFAKIDAYGGITIIPAPPDLALSALSASGGGTVKDNENLLITAEAANQGVWPSEAGLLEVKIVDGQGVVKWSNAPGADVRPLAPGKSLSFPLGPFQAAALGIAPGSYQIVAALVGSPDLKELNDTNDSASLTLTVQEGTPPPPPPAALALKALALDSTLVWRGNTVKLTAEFESAASTGIVQYLLSTDQTPGGDDTSLLPEPGTKAVTVDPRVPNSNIDSLAFEAPGSGTWWVLAVVGNVVDGNYLTAKLKVYYPLVVIDTYNPTGPIDFSPINWVMDLFGPEGDKAASPGYDVWTTDITSDPAVLAYSDGFNNFGSVHALFPQITYTKGIEPGVEYYVRMRTFVIEKDSWTYAIRLLASGPDTEWDYPGLNDTDLASVPVEGGQGIPKGDLVNAENGQYQLKELTLNSPLSCKIGQTEVDWFHFKLP
jgi:hypothetical protein